MFKIIAIDIDETLLTNQHQLLPSTIEAIHDAHAQGIKVVLCSGRPLAGLLPWLKQLGIDGPDEYVVTYNGGIVQSVAGEIISKHLLDNATYRRLTEFAKLRSVPFNVLDDESNIYTADRDVNWVIVQQAAENTAGLYIRTPDELPEDFTITKGLFVGDPKQLDEIQPAVEREFTDCYVVRAGQWFLEVMHANVNKGAGLHALAQSLHVTADQVMAIGDEGNDIAMFDYAGCAVAMGNGSDEAKAHADHVVATNDEGGVAEAIRQYALH
jgi:Cof subfamily protein (haloacid dehalogenase superfamily)